MQAVRTSTRERKPKRHFDDEVVKKEQISDEEADKEKKEEGKNFDLLLDPKLEKSASSIERLSQPTPYAAPSTTGRGYKIIRKPQEFYTPEESLAIMHFILNEIHSKAPGREGRVAKRRVEASCMELWDRCKRHIKSRRDPTSLRGHYHFNCRKLHEFQGLTIEEKVDLYYAMDIKVDLSFRKKLIDQFGVEFSKDGRITGSTMINHWDLVHSESEREDDDEECSSKNSKNWVRFSEMDDGLMWQFILDDINADNVRHPYGKKIWGEFRKKHRGLTGMNRASETFRGRYQRILLPNLYKMPFDIETKAAFYYSLSYAVPEDYRETLINATGVKINKDGIITSYPKRPHHFELQSRPHENVIGITSANKFSSLKHPYKRIVDVVPFTEKEEEDIWEYIRQRGWQNGKMQRFKDKMSGWVFWKQFMAAVPTKRTWQSLSQHFTGHMMHNIMNTKYDMKTKIELYFLLSMKPDDEVLAQFQSIASLVFHRNGAIRYAVGKDFLVGRKERGSMEGNESSDDEPYEYNYQFQDLSADGQLIKTEIRTQKPRLTSNNLRSFMDQVAENDYYGAEGRMAELEAMNNSARYPYVPKPGRHRKRRIFLNTGEPDWVERDHVLHGSYNPLRPSEEKPPAFLSEKEPKLEPVDDFEDFMQAGRHHAQTLMPSSSSSSSTPGTSSNIPSLQISTTAMPGAYYPMKPAHLLMNLARRGQYVERESSRRFLYEERRWRDVMAKRNNPAAKPAQILALPRMTTAPSAPRPQDGALGSPAVKRLKVVVPVKEAKPEKMDPSSFGEMMDPKAEESGTSSSKIAQGTPTQNRIMINKPIQKTPTMGLAKATPEEQKPEKLTLHNPSSSSSGPQRRLMHQAQPIRQVPLGSQVIRRVLPQNSASVGRPNSSSSFAEKEVKQELDDSKDVPTRPITYVTRHINMQATIEGGRVVPLPIRSAPTPHTFKGMKLTRVDGPIQQLRPQHAVGERNIVVPFEPTLKKAAVDFTGDNEPSVRTVAKQMMLMRKEQERTGQLNNKSSNSTEPVTLKSLIIEMQTAQELAKTKDQAGPSQQVAALVPTTITPAALADSIAAETTVKVEQVPKILPRIVPRTEQQLLRPPRIETAAEERARLTDEFANFIAWQHRQEAAEKKKREELNKRATRSSRTTSTASQRAGAAKPSTSAKPANKEQSRPSETIEQLFDRFTKGLRNRRPFSNDEQREEYFHIVNNEPVNVAKLVDEVKEELVDEVKKEPSTSDQQ